MRIIGVETVQPQCGVCCAKVDHVAELELRVGSENRHGAPLIVGNVRICGPCLQYAMGYLNHETAKAGQR